MFLKSWGFKDDKYDIPMCQYHSTRPQPIQLVPTPASEACFKRISVLNDSICILWNDAILCSSSKSYISSHFFQVERGLSPKWGDFPLKGKCWGVLHISWSFVFIWSSFYTTVKISVKISMFFYFQTTFQPRAEKAYFIIFVNFQLICSFSFCLWTIS